MAYFRRAAAISRRSFGSRMWHSPAACGASPFRIALSGGGTPVHSASLRTSPKSIVSSDGFDIPYYPQVTDRRLSRPHCNTRHRRVEFEVLHRSEKVPLDMEDTASSITELHIRDAGLVGAAAPSVEEVQPKVAAGEQDFAEFNSSKSRDANMPEAVQKHDARRCHICGAKVSPFGFGPPLTRTGVDLWACSAHRLEVERQLTGARRTAMCEDTQPSLF
jgi:hypothetical protein